MKIEHIAIWVKDFDLMNSFYQKYFDVTPGNIYERESNGFKSIFLSFKEGARIELMTSSKMDMDFRYLTYGYAHIALSLGSKEEVNRMTKVFRDDKVHIVKEPYNTGDGYYESTILDPEGNMIELTV